MHRLETVREKGLLGLHFGLRKTFWWYLDALAHTRRVHKIILQFGLKIVCDFPPQQGGEIGKGSEVSANFMGEL